MESPDGAMLAVEAPHLHPILPAIKEGGARGGAAGSRKNRGVIAALP
jgi:hypothetical protein